MEYRKASAMRYCIALPPAALDMPHRYREAQRWGCFNSKKRYFLKKKFVFLFPQRKALRGLVILDPPFEVCVMHVRHICVSSFCFSFSVVLGPVEVCGHDQPKDSVAADIGYCTLGEKDGA